MKRKAIYFYICAFYLIPGDWFMWVCVCVCMWMCVFACFLAGGLCTWLNAYSKGNTRNPSDCCAFVHRNHILCFFSKQQRYMKKKTSRSGRFRSLQQIIRMNDEKKITVVSEITTQRDREEKAKDIYGWTLVWVPSLVLIPQINVKMFPVN